MIRGTVSHVLLESGVGLGFGLAAGLITILVALLVDPLVAPFVPVAMLCGLVGVSQPIFGAFFLVFFSYPDALASKIFFAVPITPFKLFAAITLCGMLLRARDFIPDLRKAIRHPVVVSFLCFGMAWSISILAAQDKGAAISWGMDLATTFILLPIIAVALAQERLAIWGVWLLAGASLVSALVLIADIVTGIRLISTSEAATTARTAEGFDRSSGASNANPTTAATMLLAGTIVALVHALETPKYRAFFVAIAVLGTGAILLSFARSAMLTYVVVVFGLGISYRKDPRVLPIAILGLIGMVAVLPFMPDTFFDRITSIFDGGGDWTLNRRFTYNVIGVDLFQSFPVFGVGPGNFYEFFTHQDYRFLPGRTLYGRQLHNMYLSVAVEYGVVGFACFAAILAASLRTCLKIARAPASRDLGVAARSLFWGMIAFFLVSVFVPNEYIKYTWLLPGLAVALHLANEKSSESKRSTDSCHWRKSGQH